MKILIIGGDARMKVAYNKLLRCNYEVSTLGLFEGDNGSVTAADILLFPVPTTRDGITVNCPLTDKKIPLDIVTQAKDNAIILSGGYSFSRKHINYLEDDGYCLLNAVPTAEGAIAEAITAADFTLWQSKILVIGAGRVGKILYDRLKGLKCDVTVSARKPSDFAMLDALQIKHIHTRDVPSNAGEYDIIFNTVDVPIFKGALENLKNTIVFDLSSKGCMDFNKAQELGIRARLLPGIPGKSAPVTAGKIIAQMVIQYIEE